MTWTAQYQLIQWVIQFVKIHFLTDFMKIRVSQQTLARLKMVRMLLIAP